MLGLMGPAQPTSYELRAMRWFPQPLVHVAACDQLGGWAGLIKPNIDPRNAGTCGARLGDRF